MCTMCLWVYFLLRDNYYNHPNWGQNTIDGDVAYSLFSLLKSASSFNRQVVTTFQIPLAMFADILQFLDIENPDFAPVNGNGLFIGKRGKGADGIGGVHVREVGNFIP